MLPSRVDDAILLLTKNLSQVIVDAANGLLHVCIDRECCNCAQADEVIIGNGSLSHVYAILCAPQLADNAIATSRAQLALE